MAKKLTKAEMAMEDHGQVFLSRVKAAAEGLDKTQIRSVLRYIIKTAITTGLNKDRIILKIVGDILG